MLFKGLPVTGWTGRPFPLFQESVVKLYLVGIGTKGLDQITLEGLKILKQSEKILSFQVRAHEMVGFAAAQDLVDPEFIDDLYIDGAIDNDNYARILNRIHEVGQDFETVAVLVQGHPLLGVTISQRLKAAYGTQVRAIAAPSSLDNLFIERWRDPLDRGSLMIDANRMLLFGQNLNPEIDTYIYHVCSVGNSATNFLEPWRGNRLEILRDHLLRFWPADHVIEFLHSPDTEDNSGPLRVLSTTVGELATAVRDVHFGMTLLVPGRRPASVDREFLKLLRPVTSPQERAQC